MYLRGVARIVQLVVLTCRGSVRCCTHCWVLTCRGSVRCYTDCSAEPGAAWHSSGCPLLSAVAPYKSLVLHILHKSGTIRTKNCGYFTIKSCMTSRFSNFILICVSMEFNPLLTPMPPPPTIRSSRAYPACRRYTASRRPVSGSRGSSAQWASSDV